MSDIEWRLLRCSNCPGSMGMVQTMGGVEDCPVCGCSGVEGYVLPNGTLAEYPGGPLLGRVERGVYESCEPTPHYSEKHERDAAIDRMKAELDALRSEHEAHRKWWDATGMRPDLLDAFRAAHDAAEKVMRP